VRPDTKALGVRGFRANLLIVKFSLDHLPAAKRAELAHVVAVLREGFAVAGRQAPRLRDGRLLKIILSGSYARGDWVEDPIGRYFSDYDILVIVDHEDLTDVAKIWLPTEARLNIDVGEGTVLRTPVQPIYHSLDDVNDRLRRGRYFFTDIAKEGIVRSRSRGFRWLGQSGRRRTMRCARPRRISRNGSRVLRVFLTLPTTSGQKDVPKSRRSNSIRLSKDTTTASFSSAHCTVPKRTI
jgi:predicted nucleotidyltransferase